MWFKMVPWGFFTLKDRLQISKASFTRDVFWKGNDLQVPDAHLSFAKWQFGLSVQGLLSKMDPVAQVVHPFLELQPGLHFSDLFQQLLRHLETRQKDEKRRAMGLAATGLATRGTRYKASVTLLQVMLICRSLEAWVSVSWDFRLELARIWAPFLFSQVKLSFCKSISSTRAWERDRESDGLKTGSQGWSKCWAEKGTQGEPIGDK